MGLRFKVRDLRMDTFSCHLVVTLEPFLVGGEEHFFLHLALEFVCQVLFCGLQDVYLCLEVILLLFKPARTNSVNERDLELVRCELKNARDQAHQFEDKHSTTRAELDAAVAARSRLGQLQDGLEDPQRHHEMATERVHTEVTDFKSEPHVLQQNRLQIKPVDPRVYDHNSKWQEQDEAGKARRQALECKTSKATMTATSIKTATRVKSVKSTAPIRPAVASRLTDYLRDPR
ncbi:hypothetical protein BBJ29_003284 [Phytophthora kernoviae]|uniref:Uncharacterized protein n=1 Tax=Phytophthora kernoviae TaxID=325452 RepID=A0A3R7GMP3_9STRA|nr:hypothetical protein BBJ29_003284 [Phytophthora kernoviae]